jgi:hypothetical protein
MKDSNFVLDEYEQSIEDMAETLIPASAATRARLNAILDGPTYPPQGGYAAWPNSKNVEADLVLA